MEPGQNILFTDVSASRRSLSTIRHCPLQQCPSLRIRQSLSSCESSTLPSNPDILVFNKIQDGGQRHVEFHRNV